MELCIAAIRKRQGLSQTALAAKVTALAAKVNVTQEVISRIETGDRPLRVNELPLYAAALNCTIEELLGNLSPQATRAVAEEPDDAAAD